MIRTNHTRLDEKSIGLMNPSHQVFPVRTPTEARQWFFDHGISITEWARSRGFSREVVYALLAGRTRGTRGEAHHAAVALGLKPLVNDQSAANGGTAV